MFKTCIVTYTYPTSHMIACNGYYLIMYKMETIAKPTRSVFILENVERSKWNAHFNVVWTCDYEAQRCENV